MVFDSNKITRLISRAINVLFLSHPQRTSFGILLGVTINGAIKAFRVYLERSTDINYDAFDLTTCICFSLVIIHIKTIINYIRNGSQLNEELEKIFYMIYLLKKEGLSEWQTKQMYVNLYKKFLDAIDFNKEIKSELKKDDKKAEEVKAENK